MLQTDHSGTLKAFALDDIELSELGIDDTSEAPSLHNFPPKFSRKAFHIWRDTINSRPKNTVGTINDQWKWVAETYIAQCNAKGLFPWATSAETSKTDIAVYLLSSARRTLKAFFKKYEFFKKMEILSTSRSYIFKKDSFAIEIVANLFPIKDAKLAELKRWLILHPPKGPLFRQSSHAGNYFRRMYESFDSEVFVRLELANPLRPRLVVNIKFNSPILLPYRDAPLTKEYIVNYVDQRIWLPIVRTYRFDNAGWRLF